MGGKGSSGPGRSYMLPIALTREMQLAFDIYKVTIGTPDDFKPGLQVFRTGLVALNMLHEDGLESMTKRKGNDQNPLVMDAELDFFVARGWITDFRQEHQDRKELQRKQTGEAVITKMLNDVIPQWTLLQPKAQTHWLKIAQENSTLEASQKIIALATPTKPLENPAGDRATTTNNELAS
jgi:hypothetical protein